MKMLRHYFVSEDLDDLEAFEEDLERGGVPTPQIHVLSLDDTEVENHHHLHDVKSLMKKDVIHSASIGAIVGAVAAVMVLSMAFLFEWHTTPLGWMPFIFLAVICLGFFTWEGGFIGIQTINHHFKRFETVLNEGKHVFFCDLEPGQEAILERIVRDHPRAELAGTGTSAPHWVLALQKRLTHFFGETMP